MTKVLKTRSVINALGVENRSERKERERGALALMAILARIAINQRGTEKSSI